MNSTYILDCTLRDGGYCNNWRFGNSNIKKIVSSLVDANIDIIECGFLTNRVQYDEDVSKYTKIDKIASIFPIEKRGKLFVAMINYGEYDVNDLPEYNGTGLDGIRVAFHKKNMLEALKVCKKIKNKGYKVFVQAMVSLSYDDNEFFTLISKVNEVEPYAFYIVDSFGMMKKKNLIRLFYMAEHNLKEDILIGFHSHNNMQLAYSNAQCLIEAQTNRNLIIDSSIYGMGRGAGNLNTELLVEYLNENTGGHYQLKPLLNVIDEILNGFYQKSGWGYSLPNYLSASHWVHPNYAGYLSAKNTLTVEAMDEIFSLMDSSKKYEFDMTYIEEIYTRYMECGKTHDEHIAAIQKLLCGKTVLLIAPGQSASKEASKVRTCANRENIVTIAVNFDYSFVKTDLIFVSNMRRFKQIQSVDYERCIVTSNIAADRAFAKISYYELINSVDAVKDNAGMMAIQFLLNMGVKNILLAGFDGYSYDSEENYASTEMEYSTQRAIVDAMNLGINKMLCQYRKFANVEFITKEKYLH